jgi:hypothetical protein
LGPRRPLPGVRELAPLRRAAQGRRSRPHPRPVQLQGARPRIPRPRRPPRPGLPTLVRQDLGPAQGRPGRRRPRGPPRGRHRDTRSRMARRRCPPHRRTAPLHLGRHPRLRTRLHVHHRRLTPTSPGVAPAVRTRQNRCSPARFASYLGCGQSFGKGGLRTVRCGVTIRGEQ